MARSTFDPARNAWTIPKDYHPFFAKPHGEVLRQAMINMSSGLQRGAGLDLVKTTRGLCRFAAETSEALRSLSSANLKWVPITQMLKTSPYMKKVSTYDPERTVLLLGAYRKHEVLVEVPLTRPVCNDLDDVLMRGGTLARCGREDIMRTIGALSRGELCGGCGAHSTALKACSRCQKVKYCNQHCQKLHWPDHKQYCKEHSA